MSKPVTALTTFGASTSGTTTQLDNNFLACTTSINDLNTYSNYMADTGAANAYVVTLAAGLTGALTDGLLIQMKASAANTGASTLNYNGGGTKPIVNIDGTALASGVIPANAIVQLQYSSSVSSWQLQTQLSAAASASAGVPVRQTVLSGPINSSGFPVLLPTSCANLSIATANITASAPMIVTASNGFGSTGAIDRTGVSNANLTWNCTANAINFLGVVVNADTTLTAFVVANTNGNQPVYQYGGAATNGAANYTFNTQEMTMRAGNGNAGNAQTYSVFVGEANCNSNAAVTVTNYAYLGRYFSGFTATLPAANTTVAASHNLGTNIILRPQFIIECTSADIGYAVGDRLSDVSVVNSAGTFLLAQSIYYSRMTVGTVNGGGSFNTNAKNGAGNTALTAASWKYGFQVSRGF